MFDDAPIDQAVEGIVNGIFFNQGHVCCAGPGCWLQESIADTLLDRLKRAAGDAAPRRPAGQEHRHRRDQLAPSSSTRSPSLAAAGRGRGRAALVAAVPAAGHGLLVPADGVHRGEPVAPDRPGGDLRAGPVGAHVPHPGGGGGEGQQHPVRAVRRGLDREGQPDPVDGAAAARRAWSGPTPTTGSTRPARSAGTGSPGSGGRAAGPGWPRTSMPDRRPAAGKNPGHGEDRPKTAGQRPAERPCRDRPCRPRSPPAAGDGPPGGGPAGQRSRPLDVRKTYKLFIGGAFPRSESGRSYPVGRAGRRRCSPTPRGPRARTPRDAVVAARKAVAGWSGATAYNRGQVLYRVAEMTRGPGGAVHRGDR